MIECMKGTDIPEFYINQDGFDSITNDCEFHDRIVDFIKANINKEDRETLLCYFVHENGDIQYADLPKSSVWISEQSVTALVCPDCTGEKKHD